ncbi:hypothetical protein MMC14_004816 [Varicellaria rhodocarpa]|nr:hypothetical protein [Varicellaria rhodocarpa]
MAGTQKVAMIEVLAASAMESMTTSGLQKQKRRRQSQDLERKISKWQSDPEGYL